jgi:hypothetical protein
MLSFDGGEATKIVKAELKRTPNLCSLPHVETSGDQDRKRTNDSLQHLEVLVDM